MRQFRLSKIYLLLMAVSLAGCGGGWFTPSTPTPLPGQNFPLPFLWEAQLRADVTIPLQNTGNILLTTTSKGHTAFDTLTGQTVWENELFGTEDPQKQVVTGKYLLYVGSYGIFPNISALEIQTGRPLWSSGIFDVIYQIVAGPKVYVQRKGGSLTALDLQTGQDLWHLSLPRAGIGDIFYEYQTNKLYALGEAHYDVLNPLKEEYYLYQLDGETGQVLNETRLPSDFDGWPSRTSPFAPGVIAYPWGLLDLPSNQLLQAETIGYFPGGTFPEVRRGINLLYFQSQAGGIRAIELDTQKIVWDYLPASDFRLISNLVRLGTTVYVLSQDSKIHAIDEATAQEIGWVKITRPNTGIPNTGSLATDGLRLFVNFGDDWVYAFGP